MKNNYNNFMTIASILILVVLVLDIWIDQTNEENTNYYENLIEDSIMLKNKIVYLCVDEGEDIHVMMSEEGLDGQCDSCFIIFSFSTFQRSKMGQSE